MKTLQTFHGSLSRGFTGNIIFQFHIPDEIHELSVELTYEKEHLEDPVSYIECFRHQLIRQAMPYLGRIPTDRQLLEMTQSMKTTLHPYRWHVRRKCAYAWDKEKNPVKRGTLFQRMSSLQRAKRYVKNHRQCIPGNRK